MTKDGANYPPSSFWASTLEVRYGNGARLLSAASKGYETDHVVVLANLIPNTSNRIEVRARDIAGNLSSAVLENEVTQGAADVTPPALSSSPVVQAISNTQIRINFSTFDFATSAARCGRVDTGAQWTVGLEGLSRNHSLTIKSLDYGPVYDCYVLQTDISGNKSEFGPYRFESAPPPTLPATPEISNIEADDGSITVFVSVPDDGGSDISQFDATCTDGSREFEASSATARIFVSGLTNDIEYTCTMTVTNGVGTSAASTPSNPVVPEFIPSGLPAWLLYEASKR